MLLQQRGFRFLPELGPALDDPSRRVWVVLFGRPPEGKNLGDRLLRHARQGAPVLLASDRAAEMNPVLEAFGVGMDFDREYRVLRAAERHHGYADCPILTPRDTSHALFRGVMSLAMNRPASFRSVPGDYRYLARLAEAERGTKLRPCMLAHRRHPVVLISDHSLFINSMLTSESNLTFAANLIEVAAAQEVVLVVDGRVLHPAMFPPGFPDLTPQASVRVLDRALRAAEEAGVFRNLDARTVAATTAALTVVVAAVLGLWVLRRPASAPDLLQRGPALLVAFGGDRPPATEERDLRIPAQEYVSAWWKRFRMRQRLPAGTPLDVSRLEISAGSNRARRGVERDLRDLGAAVRAGDRPLPVAGFQRLLAAARRCDEAGASLALRGAPAEAAAAEDTMPG